MATELQLIEASRRDHIVHFYRHDDELVDRVGRYARRAITSDSAAVVLATPSHRHGVETWLGGHGIDPGTARASGLLYLMDARETLGRFSADGRLDERDFREVVGGLIRQAAAGGRAVYLYGEMVAVLWEAGLIPATIALESLWNELGRELDFSLFCGYPASALGDDAAGQALAELCSLHSALIWAPPPFSDASEGVVERSQTFPHRADSPRAARHFVSATLEKWGVEGELLDDAALVVTELTSNALLHAHSDSSVTVALTSDAIYLSVHDHNPVLPTRRPATDMQPSGRGLGMVAVVSRHWGADLVDEGKIVWAELRR
jgi:anti-sigma regulatory factor (Ser/Thr protein kinase)